MLPPKKVTAAGLAVSATLVAAGGAHDHKMKTKALCGVPDRAYQSGTSSALVGGLSQTAILVPALAADARDGAQFKLFTLAQPRLAVDHCMISRVSVSLRNNGDWTLSLLAEQNPRVLIDPTAFAVLRDDTRDAIKQTGHIKRNKFTVRVRCYSATPLELADGAAVGRPLLLVLEPPPFWVQNGQPQEMTLSGKALALPASFGVIDRVEVELSYR